MKEILKINYEDLHEEENGKEPKNYSPVLDYCRKLIKEGTPSDYSLAVFRHGELSMVVKNIGKGAKQVIKEDDIIGPIFAKYRAIPTEVLKKLRSISNRKAENAIPASP